MTSRGVIVMCAAIFFPYNTFDGCFPSSAGKPWEVAIYVYLCTDILGQNETRNRKIAIHIICTEKKKIDA